MIGNIILSIFFVLLVFSPLFFIFYSIWNFFLFVFYGLRNFKQHNNNCSVILTSIKNFNNDKDNFIFQRKEEEVPSPSSIPYSFGELKCSLTPDDDDIELDEEICLKAKNEEEYRVELERNSLASELEPINLDEFQNELEYPMSINHNLIYEDVIQLYT